jgi:CelD/BcsL family acetyltransferase involved in cellulose biosynthesis
LAQVTERFRFQRAVAPRSAIAVRREFAASATKAESISESDGFHWRDYFVEWAEVDELPGLQAAWNDLTARALEGNVFLDPVFALAAAENLPGRERRRFLLVWTRSGAAKRHRLVALWPIIRARLGLRPAYRIWVHPYCCSGAPLLDRQSALGALDAIAAFFGERMSEPAMVSIAELSREGSFFALLRQFTESRGFPIASLKQYERAALDASKKSPAAHFVSARKRKELGRQLRRLRDRGPVAFGVASEPRDLNQQLDAFLALESKGWKGRRGEALQSKPPLEAFVREMAAAMVGRGKCRIYWLSCGDQIIASNIVLLDETNAYFWKTAYDEDFASVSPGVLLTMSMTDQLLRDDRIFSADSCAISGHPMIDRIWRSRRAFADVAVAFGADVERRFHAAVRRERFFLSLKETAKSALARLGLL